jgi:hypothetical protein
MVQIRTFVLGVFDLCNKWDYNPKYGCVESTIVICRSY